MQIDLQIFQLRRTIYIIPTNFGLQSVEYDEFHVSSATDFNLKTMNPDSIELCIFLLIYYLNYVFRLLTRDESRLSRKNFI